MTITTLTKADAPAPPAVEALPSHRRAAPRPFVLTLLFAVVFLALWQGAASAGWLSDIAPTPARTWTRAGELLSNPFFRDGPASVGIFWHIVASLRRVLVGFVIAMLIALPLGYVIAVSPVLNRALDPFNQILRPVSPLAWLPLGLALLRDSENTAVFVIVLTALWPTLLNTVTAVQGVHPTYLRLAATLGARRWQCLAFIVIPAALPGIVTGMRQSLSTAWLVIVAAEMLVGGRGVGFFVWNMWNRLDIDAIVVVIVLIGLVGLVLDQALAAVQKVVRYV